MDSNKTKSSKKEIKNQEPEFLDPVIDLKQPLNNQLREFTQTVTKLIPKAGKIISFAVGVFWPKDKTSMFEQLQSQIQYMIDLSIFKAVYKNMKTELYIIQEEMQAYVNAGEEGTERGSIMTSMLSRCNALKNKIDGSENKEHLLSILVPLSLLHMSILRERKLFGKEIYQKDRENEDWSNHLDSFLGFYHESINKNYTTWKKWRLQNITYTTKTYSSGFSSSTYAFVKDKLYDPKFKVEIRLGSYSGEKTAKAKRDHISNCATHLMVDMLSPSAMLHTFVPGRENENVHIPDSLRSVEFGPYNVNNDDANPYLKYVSHIEGDGGTKAIHLPIENKIKKIAVGSEGEVRQIWLNDIGLGKKKVTKTDVKNYVELLLNEDEHVTKIIFHFGEEGKKRKIQWRMVSMEVETSQGNKLQSKSSDSKRKIKKSVTWESFSNLNYHFVGLKDDSIKNSEGFNQITVICEHV